MTAAEKELIKSLKKEHKDKELKRTSFVKEETKPVKNHILTGILEDEYVLEDNHPVHWDYLYVIENNDGTAKVIRSNISGDVMRLKAQYKNVKNVRRCSMVNRNLF